LVGPPDVKVIRRRINRGEKRRTGPSVRPSSLAVHSIARHQHREGGLDTNELQNTGGGLVDIIQSNREIRPRGGTGEIRLSTVRSLRGTVPRNLDA
jgi:hypothetical protein